MRPRNLLAGIVAVSVLFQAWAPSVAAQVPDPDPERFAEAFAEFATWDAKNAVPRDGILFVGSSSIVRWNTAEAFPDMPVINRGFGGSQASDATHWVREAVLQYDPAVVVYYEGDNDTGAGKKAPQILADVREFAEAVLAHDPGAQIAFLSIKPSLLRWNVWSEAVAANELIEAYADGNPNLHYVDVANPMLDRDGQPDPDHFVSDGLHMTPAGYAVWNRVVGAALGHLHH
ncbi:MAG TPA: GDSL-type esterase/lipase family protein [Longimicrobiales bacterium]|nr:GDSL-type esterase/lipase family protein [Longimicrobiales bacterium]